MSLYDDIGLDRKEIAESNSDVSGWSVGHRLLHSHTKSKKSSGLGGAPSSYSRKRGSGGLAPVVDLNRSGGGIGKEPYEGNSSGGGSVAQRDGEIRFNHITGKMEAGPAPRSFANFGASTYPLSSPFADMSVEYDPSYPNEYADFAKRLKEQKSVEREEERRREDEERRRRREEERKEKLSKMAASFKPPTSLYNEIPAPTTAPSAPKETESTKRLALYDSSSDSEDDSQSSTTRSAMSNAEFAPPAVLLEESKPATPPPPGFREAAGEDGQSAFSIGGKGGSVASKIMAKMGYRHGSGLGRDEQGMSMALQVEKTSRRGGKILHERDIATKEAATTGTQSLKADTGVTNMELLKNPSKVLLLMNMVGPGEVDSELEPETAEECSKYGRVIKCVIFEVMNVPETEAVRIFVEFEKISFAIKAAIDLNGRYFGGRVVRAAFYSHDKFLNMQLVDEPM